MKKLVFVAVCLLMINSIVAQAKHSVGYVNAEGEEVALEVLSSGLRSSESLKGNEYKLQFKGATTVSVLKKGQEIEFIVHVSGGIVDPEKDVRIVKFDVSKKNRSTRTFIAGPLNKGGDVNPTLIGGGEIVKVDDNTIKVTVSIEESGEYALVVGDVSFVKNNDGVGGKIGFHCFTVED
jgi:hypothetical protein